MRSPPSSTVKAERTPDHSGNRTYAQRLIKSLEEEQAALAGATGGSLGPVVSDSVEIDAAGSARRKVERRPAAAESEAHGLAAVFFHEAESVREEMAKLEKEYTARIQRLKYRNELLFWRGEFDALLLRASPEYRIGALIASLPGSADCEGVDAILAFDSKWTGEEGQRIRRVLAEILRDAAVFEKLMPLLDGVRHGSS
jgi:hypothetical protein